MLFYTALLQIIFILACFMQVSGLMFLLICEKTADTVYIVYCGLIHEFVGFSTGKKMLWI